MNYQINEKEKKHPEEASAICTDEVEF